MNLIFKISFNVWPEISWKLIQYKYAIIAFNIFMYLFLALMIFFLIKIIQTIIKINKIQNDHTKLIKQLKLQVKTNLYKLEGKQFIKGFINYLETIIIKWKYNTIEQILKKLEFDELEIKQINNVIYKDECNVENLVEKIKIRFS